MRSERPPKRYAQEVQHKQLDTVSRSLRKTCTVVSKFSRLVIVKVCSSKMVAVTVKVNEPIGISESIKEMTRLGLGVYRVRKGAYKASMPSGIRILSWRA